MASLFEKEIIKNFLSTCLSGKHEQCLINILDFIDSVEDEKIQAVCYNEYLSANRLLSNIRLFKLDRKELENDYDNIPTDDVDDIQERIRRVNKRERLDRQMTIKSTQIQEKYEEVIELIEDLKKLKVTPELTKLTYSQKKQFSNENPSTMLSETTSYTKHKIFISYSHADELFLKDVKRHLKLFSNSIDYWDDTNIQPGQKWKTEIREAISGATIAILLISTDFLGSEFITTDELPPLLKAAEESGVVILSVILKPCAFEDFPNINQFQAINPPDKPLSSLNDNDKEEVYLTLYRRVKNIVKI